MNLSKGLECKLTFHVDLKLGIVLLECTMPLIGHHTFDPSQTDEHCLLHWLLQAQQVSTVTPPPPSELINTTDAPATLPVIKVQWSPL